MTFDLLLDLVDHRLVVRTDRGEVEELALRDGLSVAVFDRGLHTLLDDLGIDGAIRELPFGTPVSDISFAEDEAHASYDATWVQRAGARSRGSTGCCRSSSAGEARER